MKPKLAITMGDPWGIGAEVIEKALPKFRSQADFRVYGDPDLLKSLNDEEVISVTQGPYKNSKAAGQASWRFLEAAMEDYFSSDKNKSWDAVVTAPISKSHIQEAGFAFPGHTEYFADKTQTSQFMMMMASPELKVSLVTIHEPLKKVSSLLTQEKIIQSIRLTHQSLIQDYAIKEPRVAVCAFNPHAGEQGLLGDEEIKIIEPAIVEANRLGFICQGPQVPDAVFHEAYQKKWDAIVCMYHDQGLIPFKMLHFHDGVNVTLGLPMIRTSPDHGTAMDIVGKNIADTRSMEAAIQMAIDMSRSKMHFKNKG